MFHDNTDELTGVDENGTQINSYSYDANGNRTGTGYSTTVMNETLTSPGGVTYTYDRDGNMISADSGGTITTYVYDYRNRLTEVEQGGVVIVSYTYNALNQRIWIDDNGTQTWTVYNGTSADAEPYADFNGSGTLTERYLGGPGAVNGAVVDELLARTSSGGSTAWYLTDKLGSVDNIVSSSGSALDTIVYDAFGNVLSESSPSNGDRFKYAGMEYDSATGQYYDHARYYLQTIGHFASDDPAAFRAGDANLFRYVRNLPTVYTDPTGMQEQGQEEEQEQEQEQEQQQEEEQQQEQQQGAWENEEHWAYEWNEMLIMNSILESNAQLEGQRKSQVQLANQYWQQTRVP